MVFVIVIIFDNYIKVIENVWVKVEEVKYKDCYYYYWVGGSSWVYKFFSFLLRFGVLEIFRR